MRRLRLRHRLEWLLGVFVAALMVRVWVAPSAAQSPEDLVFERVGTEPFVGGSLFALAAGDLDADGRPDLVTGDADGDQVAVLFGNGDGTFVQPPSLFSLEDSSGPRAIALADVDANGTLDVVVAAEVSNTVAVLLNPGDGVLGRPQSFPVGEGPGAIAVGDVNGDGRPDLVVANNLDSTVSVLLNQGGGRFAAGATFEVGLGPVAVTLVELNGDRHQDLLVTCIDSGEALVGSVQIFRGGGDGSFVLLQELQGEMLDSPVAATVFDANGDGVLDVLVLNQDLDDVAVFTGAGDGTFAWSGANFPVGIQPNAFAAADFNGDGRFDLAVSSEFEDKVSVLLGLGDGSFAPKVDFDVAPAPFAVALADFDRDRRLDIAVTSQDAEAVSLLLNRTALPAQCPGDCDGSGEVTIDELIRMVNIALGTTELNQCRAGDANGDGEITIDEIVRAVNAALSGCSSS